MKQRPLQAALFFAILVVTALPAELAVQICGETHWTRPRELFEDYRRETTLEVTSSIESGALSRVVNDFFECWKKKDVACALVLNAPSVDRETERKTLARLYRKFELRSYTELGAIAPEGSPSTFTVYTAIIGIASGDCVEDVMMTTWTKHGDTWRVGSIVGEIL